MGQRALLHVNFINPKNIYSFTSSLFDFSPSQTSLLRLRVRYPEKVIKSLILQRWWLNENGNRSRKGIIEAGKAEETRWHVLLNDMEVNAIRIRDGFSVCLQIRNERLGKSHRSSTQRTHSAPYLSLTCPYTTPQLCLLIIFCGTKAIKKLHFDNVYHQRKYTYLILEKWQKSEVFYKTCFSI